MQQLETEHLSLTLTTKLTTSPNTKQELRMCSSERLKSSVSYWPLSWQHLQIQKILRKLWETERMSVCTLFWVEDKTRAESLYGWLCERNISDRRVTQFCSGKRPCDRDFVREKYLCMKHVRVKIFVKNYKISGMTVGVSPSWGNYHRNIKEELPTSRMNFHYHSQ